jgi:hypothetical protein
LGLEYLHLGGGVGGRDDDSLFQFKAGFSKERFTYRTWQYISDMEIYKEICRQKNIHFEHENNFFPLYRSL